MKKKKRSSKRDLIMEVAFALFAEHGFDGVSLDTVIERSETSKGTLYHHFSSKEDLYVQVLEKMVEALWDTSYQDLELGKATKETFWQLILSGWLKTTKYLLENDKDMLLWKDFQRRWRTLSGAGPTKRLRERSLQMGEYLAQVGQTLGCVRGDLSPRHCAELVEALDVITDDWFFDVFEKEGIGAALERQMPLSLDLIWRMLSPHDDTKSPYLSINISNILSD